MILRIIMVYNIASALFPTINTFLEIVRTTTQLTVIYYIMEVKEVIALTD